MHRNLSPRASRRGDLLVSAVIHFAAILVAAILAALVLAAIATIARGATLPDGGPGINVERLLDAIRQVESSNRPDPPDGDDGKAVGPMQIWRCYWADSRVPGRYEQCRDEPYARAVVMAYWRRWCPQALAREDLETLARTHNGGPRGGHKRSTRAYWVRCRVALAAARPTTQSPPPGRSGRGHRQTGRRDGPPVPPPAAASHRR